MSDNSQKTPLARTFNLAVSRRVNDGIQITGKALPCSVVSISGAFVTVKFEVTSQFTLPQVTMPICGSKYVRLPIQIGDPGVAIAADAYLGGISGDGGGTASLSTRANLSTLSFLPIGNKSWPTVDQNAVVISAPNGAVLTEDTNMTALTLTPLGIVIKFPAGKSIQLTTLPTSAAGLPPGSLWNSAGTVKVV